jgi:hypothetical protein
MSQPKRILGLLGAFVLGCAATQLGPRIVPPARAGTAPQKWEYTCLQTVEKDPQKVATIANKYGQEGWELSAAIPADFWATWCFKRPLP